MKPNEIYSVEKRNLKVLAVGERDALVIDVERRGMPFEMPLERFSGLSASSVSGDAEAALSPDELKEARERYATISFIVPFIADERERARMIRLSSQRYGISAKTVRRRLCDYLALGLAGLRGSAKKEERPLTADERNFRWALNKYYYAPIALSLKETYRRLLKDRYCDESGKLLGVYPSFRQLSYFFYKRDDVAKRVISRSGKGEFMRNHRVLLGNGIRDFCPSIGYGMLDSTVCDIFLVDGAGQLIGRPTMAACVDAYSGMCLGYSLGFDKGIGSLKKLMSNVVCDKVEWCRHFGIEIEEGDWDSPGIPHKLITDKGREYAGEAFSQLADLGIEIVNLPPYRPELKGAVEKFFDLVQGYFKKELATKGVIFEDFQERGGVDYRKKACLTLEQFEKIALACVVHYNAGRIIDLPLDKVGKCDPFPNRLFEACLVTDRDSFVAVSEETLRLTLLPRTEAVFKRNGLIVGKLRYKNESFSKRCLAGGSCVVAYDPEDAGRVWLYEGGIYSEFRIIEPFFEGKTLEQAAVVMDGKKAAEKAAEESSRQSSIDLSRAIEEIASSALKRQAKKNAGRKGK